MANDARIRVSFEYPPIPVRSFDWSAIDDNTYDGADDSNCPIGRGETREEAINDLLSQICMNKGADTDGIACRYCSAEIGVACRATITNRGG